MKKVAIDLPIIFDPHKLLIVLSGLDRTHEEILVPDIVQYIEAWGPPGDGIFLPPMTLRIFEEDFDDRLDRFFGFDTRTIEQNNFCAGIRLLQHAKREGMITLFDSARFTTIGQEVLKTDKFYPPFYRKTLPSGKTVNLNPDLPYSLESLIGISEEQSVIPIFGDLEFLRYVNEKRPEATIRDETGQLEVDEQTKTLLDCPKVVTFDELLWFVKNRDTFNAVSEKLQFGNDWRLTKRDIGFMGLKFGGTLATDIALFGGAPVTSGGLFAYELSSRVFRVLSKKDKKS
jgi:hypothetical protein